MLKEYLPEKINAILPPSVLEIRLRRRKPISFLTKKGKSFANHIVTDAEFEEALALATERSLYAITEKLVNGYLPLKGGVRVGVAGESVSDGNRVKTVKNITSLVYRIPHQIFGASDFLQIDGNFRENVLIISPPACGKTTFLRDLSRRLSIAGMNVAVLDERGEIGGVVQSEVTLDLGNNADVLVGFPKSIAYENALRSLNPDYIVTDELSGESDVKGVLRAYYGGVKVAATLHGSGESAFYGDFAPLAKVFDRIIVLGKEPRVGSVVQNIVR